MSHRAPHISRDYCSNFLQQYKGTIIQSFSYLVDTVCKKVDQRTYLIRKLKTFDVDKKMLEMIYRSLVESILTFDTVTFYGHLTVKEKNRLNKIVIATKLINLKQKSRNDLYQQAISEKSRSIINDPNHPLHSCYEIMPSGKRRRTPAFKRQLYCPRSFLRSCGRKICPFPQCIPQNLAFSTLKF